MHQPVDTFKTELTLSCVVQVTYVMDALNNNKDFPILNLKLD